MNKEEKALEALLTLAFKIELTDEEIEEFFEEPVNLSIEDKNIIDNWKIDWNYIFNKKKPINQIISDK